MLDSLPERGWGVLRCDPVVAGSLWLAGLIKVQVVRPGVYNARLTRLGRETR